MNLFFEVVKSIFNRLSIVPGSIYEFREDKDPFGIIRPAQVEIIDTRAGWVKYKQLGVFPAKLRAMKTNSFRICYRAYNKANEADG